MPAARGSGPARPARPEDDQIAGGGGAVAGRLVGSECRLDVPDREIGVPQTPVGHAQPGPDTGPVGRTALSPSWSAADAVDAA